MIGLFLKALIGAIVWTLANVVYYDLKRKGVRNFGRFAAFWVGTPTTWVTFFAVPEGRQPTFKPPPDDEDTLLAEIRTDRALRRLRGTQRRGGEAGPAGQAGEPVADRPEVRATEQATE